MVRIVLSQVSKRFREDWIFRDITTEFRAPMRYAIQGPNGSGKSTLLKVLSGHLSPSSGDLQFFKDENKISADQIYKAVSYAGPYIELIEEFSIEEALRFHESFKPFYPGIDVRRCLDILGFRTIRDRQIRHLSSGQKQRVKLALSILSASDLLMLDEPSTNLDLQGMDWFHSLIGEFAGERLVIVASNEERDLTFCQQQLNIQDFKGKR